MNDNAPLPDERKLTVVFRVEAGCLGPQGASHVASYCAFAGERVATLDAGFVRWLIIPRDDKHDPEMEYRVGDKRLSHDQAARYLAVFGKSLDEFEGHLHDRITELIEEFMIPHRAAS